METTITETDADKSYDEAEIRKNGTDSKNCTIVITAIGHIYRLNVKEWVDVSQVSIPFYVYKDNADGEYKLIGTCKSKEVFSLAKLGFKWKFGCGSQKFISLSTEEETFGIGFNHPQDAKEFFTQLSWLYGHIQNEVNKKDENKDDSIAQFPAQMFQSALSHGKTMLSDAPILSLMAGYDGLLKVGKTRPLPKLSTLLKEHRIINSKKCTESMETFTPNKEPLGFNNNCHVPSHLRKLPTAPTPLDISGSSTQQPIRKPDEESSLMRLLRRHSSGDVPYVQNAAYLAQQSGQFHKNMDTIQENPHLGESINRHRLQSVPVKGQYPTRNVLYGRQEIPGHSSIYKVPEPAYGSYSSPLVFAQNEDANEQKKQQMMILRALQQGHQAHQLYGAANLSNFHLPGMPVSTRISEAASTNSLGMPSTLSGHFGTSSGRDSSGRYTFPSHLGSDNLPGLMTSNHSNKFKYSQAMGSPFSPAFSSDISSSVFSGSHGRLLNSELLGSPASPSISSEAMTSPFSPAQANKFEENMFMNYDRSGLAAQIAKRDGPHGNLNGGNNKKASSFNELITAFEPLNMENNSLGSPGRMNVQ